MSIADLAITFNQALPAQPSMGWIAARAWQDNARFARHVLQSVAARIRSEHFVTAPDFGEDYPMITALHESYQAQCRQQQAFAELRGD
jgi:hypothetical protein